MQESNDILIKILEELQINGSEFQNQIVTGELIQSGILLVFNLIILIVAIKFFMNINQELYLKENIIQIFATMKNYKNVNTDYKKKPQEEESKKKESDPFQELFNSIKQWMNKAPINRMFATIILLYFELKVFFAFVNNVVNQAIIVINCFVASEKVVLDYLANLF